MAPTPHTSLDKAMRAAHDLAVQCRRLVYLWAAGGDGGYIYTDTTPPRDGVQRFVFSPEGEPLGVTRKCA